MPKRSDRSKKTKFRRKSRGKSRRTFVDGKTGKHCCALCERVLHGVPHGKSKAEVKKLSKTERRPTALFAGVLCSGCRSQVVVEAAKVAGKIKGIEEVELRLRKYVEQVKVS